MYYVVAKEHVSLHCPDCGTSGSAEIADAGGYAPEIQVPSGFFVRMLGDGSTHIECVRCSTAVHSIEER